MRIRSVAIVTLVVGSTLGAPHGHASWLQQKSGGTAAPASAKVGNAGIAGGESTASGNMLRLNGTVQGTLGQGDRSLDDGSLFDQWVYQGRAGETLVITLSSDEFDTFLMLFDPSGTRLGGNDDASDATTDSQLVATLPVDGSYVVIANTYEAGMSGDYDLAVHAARPEETESELPMPVFHSDGDPTDRYALVVGIGDYPGTGSDLPLGPVEDADAMYTLLREHYGYPAENILVLKDSQATRNNIIAAFQQHLGQAGADGSAVFFYSGHGTQTSGNEALVAPADPEPDGKDEALVAYDALIIDDEMGALAGQLRAGQVLLIYDSCFSGTGTRGDGGAPKFVLAKDSEAYRYQPKPFDWFEGGTEAAAAKVDVDSEWLRNPTDHVFLASSAEDQLSWTNGQLGMSVFTYYLVRALQRANGTEPLAELMAGVSDATDRRVQAASNERQTPQIEGTRAAQVVGEFFNVDRSGPNGGPLE